MRTLAKLLKDVRDRRGLSREALARLLDVSSRTVLLWEGGARPRPFTEVGARARLKDIERGRRTS